MSLPNKAVETEQESVLKDRLGVVLFILGIIGFGVSFCLGQTLLALGPLTMAGTLMVDALAVAIGWATMARKSRNPRLF